MDKANRKITFEEEADLYEKEALAEIEKQHFDGTKEMGEPYSTLQLGRRVVYKARQEIANRVEVVRCKDCKHFCKAGGLLDYDYCSQNYDCDGTHSEAYPDDFCSYGERREGE